MSVNTLPTTSPHYVQSGPMVIKKVHAQTSFGSLTFLSRKNIILGLSEPENAEFLDIFILMSIKNSMLSWAEHEKN